MGCGIWVSWRDGAVAWNLVLLEPLLQVTMDGRMDGWMRNGGRNGMRFVGGICVCVCVCEGMGWGEDCMGNCLGNAVCLAVVVVLYGWIAVGCWGDTGGMLGGCCGGLQFRHPSLDGRLLLLSLLYDF